MPPCRGTVSAASGCSCTAILPGAEVQQQCAPLYTSHRISLLVCRNTGGTLSGALTASCSQAWLWTQNTGTAAATNLGAYPQDLNHLFCLPDVPLSLCLGPPRVLHARLGDHVFHCSGRLPQKSQRLPAAGFL